jgi:hypothetical protein
MMGETAADSIRLKNVGPEPLCEGVQCISIAR